MPADIPGMKLLAAVFLVSLLCAVSVAPIGPTPASGTCESALRVTLAAYSSAMVAEVIDGGKIAPYLRASDTVDLVSGNNLAVVSPPQLETWRQEIVKGLAANDSQIGRGLNFTAHMGGLGGTSSGADMANVNAFVNSSADTVGFSGVYYDYELSAVANFSWTRAGTLREATRLDSALDWSNAHDPDNSQMTATFYPTGKPVGVESVAQYRWNYSQLSAAVDGVTVQTQRYASLIGAWETNVSSLQQEFGPGIGPQLQVTLGNGASNTATVAEAEQDVAWACSAIGSPAFGHLYLWWGSTNWSEVVQVLAYLGR